MDEAIRIDWETIDNILEFEADYNKKADTLFIQSKDRRPAVSIDCDGEYWVRVDPTTGEILGIEIEDFRKVFLKRHPEITKMARQETTYIRPIVDLIQPERCPA